MPRETQVLYAACGYSGPRAEEDLILFTLDGQGVPLRLFGMRRGDNPSYLAWQNDRLYVSCENEGSATFAAYAQKEGALALQHEFTTPGSGVCHLLVRNGMLYASGYGDGAFFAADAATGEVRWRYVNEEAPRPHAHWMAFSEDGNWLYGADLGSGRVFLFEMDGALPAAKPAAFIQTAAGAGPRQPLIQKKMLYLINQDDYTVSVYGLEAPACPQPRQTLSTTAHTGEIYCASAYIRAGALFVSNRGPDTVSAFRIGADGLLDPMWESPLQGTWPRYIVPLDGRMMVACQNSGTLESYAVESGGLGFLGGLSLAGAACVVRVR